MPDHRPGLSLFEIMEMFPDEQTAHAWFARQRWGADEADRFCPRCGCTATRRSKRRPYYFCAGCKKRFSVRTGTVMEASRLPVRKWAVATFLIVAGIKGVSSTRLARDLDITQKSAWFLLHRLRDALEGIGERRAPFAGTVEVDEKYVGGRTKNMSNARRRAMREAGETWQDHKSIVVGARNRETGAVQAEVVEQADRPTLHGFVADNVAPGATVYTDEAPAYRGLPYPHETVNHGVREFVRDQVVSTNGIESFWALFQRGYQGTHHWMSPKHLPRYVAEFAERWSRRKLSTIEQMHAVVAGMVGRRLTYARLTAPQKRQPMDY